MRRCKAILTARYVLGALEGRRRRRRQRWSQSARCRLEREEESARRPCVSCQNPRWATQFQQRAVRSAVVCGDVVVRLAKHRVILGLSADSFRVVLGWSRASNWGCRRRDFLRFMRLSEGICGFGARVAGRLSWLRSFRLGERECRSAFATDSKAGRRRHARSPRACACPQPSVQRHGAIMARYASCSARVGSLGWREVVMLELRQSSGRPFLAAVGSDRQSNLCPSDSCYPLALSYQPSSHAHFPEVSMCSRCTESSAC